MAAGRRPGITARPGSDTQSSQQVTLRQSGDISPWEQARRDTDSRGITGGLKVFMEHMRGYAASGFLAHRGLLAAASGVAMAEAALLALLAPAARMLAPQATALLPLGVYHDLRWLYGYGLAWPAFGLLALALVAVRSAVSAGLIRLAWPTGAEPPPLSALMGSCMTVTALTAVLLSPVVALVFGTSVVPFSWPFLASLALMLLLVLPMSHGGVLSSWWQTLPPPAAVGWLLADFAVLTAAAALTGRLAPGWAVPVAGLAGLANARAWYGVTTAVVQSRWRTTHYLPLAPLAAVTAIALVVVVTRVAFLVGLRSSQPHHRGSQVGWILSPGQPGTVARGQAAPPAQPPPPRATRSPRGRPAVLVLAGFGSSCCNHAGDIHRILPGWWVQQFSYRGLSRSGNPIPHGAAASNLPLPLLGNRVAAQVWRLHTETGRPVDVVAESEGTLGVDAMLALHPRVPIGSVVLLSPIVAPGQDSYPALSSAATGMVAGVELQGVIWFVGGLSPFGTTGAQTFVNSVDSVGARFAAAAAQHRLRSLQLVPLADAVTLPACALPANALVVPAFHGELLGDPAVLRSVRDFLTYQPVQGRPGLRLTAELVSAGAAAWRMPQLTAPSPPCPRLGRHARGDSTSSQPRQSVRSDHGSRRGLLRRRRHPGDGRQLGAVPGPVTLVTWKHSRRPRRRGLLRARR